MRTLKDTLALYFTGLRAALSSNPSMPKARIAFIDLVWRYVLSLSVRLDRLVARWKNGTLPAPRAPQPGRTRKARTVPPRFPLPRHPGWLIRRMPATGIGVFGGQLAHLLATDTELRDFLKAAPQARRLLGPVCRMFGIALPVTPGVTLPPPPSAPLPAPQAAPASEPTAPANPPRGVEASVQPTGTAPDPIVSFSR